MTKLIAILISMFCLCSSTMAADHELVRINISGLACPFCAYSVEKNLKKLPGVDRVVVDLAAGTVAVEMLAEHTADIEEIKQAIINAGFTPGEANRSVADD